VPIFSIFINACDHFFHRLALKVKVLSQPLKFFLVKMVSSLIQSQKLCTGPVTRFHIPSNRFWISGFPH